MASSIDPRKAYPNPQQARADRAAAQQPPMPSSGERFAGSEASVPEQGSVAPDFGLSSYVGSGRLAGLTAVVTGADSGIGRAAALAFAREGCAKLVLTSLDTNEEKTDLADAVAAIEGQGGAKPGERGTAAVVATSGDLADEAFRVAVVEAAGGKIDILVNNAAFQGEAVDAVDKIPASRFERTLSVNVVAPFRLLQLALPRMAPGSSVIFTSSIEATQPEATIVDYAASKSAITSLVRSLAPELAHKHGVRVNAVCPGPVHTMIPITSFSEEKMKSFGADYPLGRAAQPAECAAAFVFLADPKNTYVAGAEIAVTGGRPL